MGRRRCPAPIAGKPAAPWTPLTAPWIACFQSAGSVETARPPSIGLATAQRPGATTAPSSTMCTSARRTQRIRVSTAAAGNTWHQTAPHCRPAACASRQATSTRSARCQHASTACHEPTSRSTASMARKLQGANTALGRTALGSAHRRCASSATSLATSPGTAFSRCAASTVVYRDTTRKIAWPALHAMSAVSEVMSSGIAPEGRAV